MQMVQKRFPKRKYSHITGGEEDENNVNEDDHDDNGTRSSPKKEAQNRCYCASETSICKIS